MGDYIALLILVVAALCFWLRIKFKKSYRKRQATKKTTYPPWTHTWFPNGYQEGSANNKALHEEDFGWAFDKVFSKINTDKQCLIKLRKKLKVTEQSGDSDLTKETIQYLLPDDEWTWPDFDKYWTEWTDKLREEKYTELSRLDLADLLLRLPVYEISNIQKQFEISAPGKRLKKAELVRHIISTLPATITNTVRTQAQNKLTEREINRHNNRFMAIRVTELTSLLSSYRYARHRLRQQLSNSITTVRPKWIKHKDPYPSHSTCAEFSGYRNFDDPSWEFDYPPHGIRCACHIETSRKS